MQYLPGIHATVCASTSSAHRDSACRQAKTNPNVSTKDLARQWVPGRRRAFQRLSVDRVEVPPFPEDIVSFALQ